uniref:Tetratricopeptide repeat protein 39C n=1 Tax=Clastoptera arizonana TaxID=38151 RepID=A0A1B6CUZ4_9HEMI
MLSESDDEFSDARSFEEDWLLARRGIQLVLNNRYAEAQQLFEDRNNSIAMAAGHCFVLFMNALMTFEEDMLAESLATLKEVEKRCAQDIGWLKSVRNKMFGNNIKDKSEAQRLEEQIMLADSQVCIALLTFLQQDISGYMRGGWALRKAWKVYQHTYNQILELYKKTFGYDKVVPGSDFPSWRLAGHGVHESPSSDWSVPNSVQTTPVTPPPSSNNYRNPFSGMFSFNSSQKTAIPAEEVERLMCAISFGYGVFQLCISLLPPSVLKLIQFLGVGGDRNGGINALMFSKKGRDMRAPLATLTLLWYYTIVSPFFALDGCEEAGIFIATNLVNESQSEFGESALFLFFKGRIHRLKSEIPQALEAYMTAVEKSPQREIQLLCLHEVSWCHLIELDWINAHLSFIQLRQRSRWSKSFYTYLAAICAGAVNKKKEVTKLSREISAVVPSESPSARKRIQDFMYRRCVKLQDQDAWYYRLLAYEMLFLWNALPSSQHNAIIRDDCVISQGEEPMVGLRLLILGAVHSYLGDYSLAVDSFNACLNERQDIPVTADDNHITAFALYELALMLLKDSKHHEEARVLLERAQKDYKCYDFEDRLNVRIYSALRTFGY